MSARHYTIALSLLAALAHAELQAQPSSLDKLVEQGQYWQSRGDYKRAAEIWEKLLLASPSNPDALYGMAAVALDAKDTATARSYLDKLRQAAPRSPLVSLLEQNLYLSQPGPAAELDKARSLAASRQMDEAIAQYDKVLQGRTPQGPLAQEYYNYLGYSTHGLDRSIDGLEGIVRTSPSNLLAQLALGKQLIRSTTRRAEGMALLQRLSSKPEVASEATEAWRSALLWIGPPAPDYRPSFEAYLKANPNDDEIRQLLAQGKTGVRTAGGNAEPSARPWRQDPDLARGFKALDGGDLATAEQAFSARLQRSPNDADALGGLGLVRMQQNDHAQAEQLLQRAARGKASWNKTLTSTRYWKLVNQASNARASGDWVRAQQLAEQAIRLDSRTPAAHNVLGHIQADQGRLEQAVQTFAQVLKRDRQNTEALSGLVSALAQSGRHTEAAQLIEKLTPEQQASIGNMGRLRAAIASGQAKAAQQRGDLAGAQRALEDAMRTDPTNPWIRLELARLYIKQGAVTEARGLVDGLLASDPNLPDAIYTSALLSTELGEWDKAYATLLRIPEANRSPEMAALEQRLWIHAQASQATKLAKIGRADEARRILYGLEQAAGDDPALLGVVASAYVDAGDANRGLSLMRQQLGRNAQPNADVLLPYTGLLLKTGQDVEAASNLRALQERPLNTAQRQAFDNLVYLYTVRQADLLRERGDYAKAQEVLASALAQRPNDPAALSAQARLYAANGDDEKALEQYKRLIRNDPDNADLQMGAAMAATQLREYGYAEGAINHAVSIAPDNPDILANAARLYRARGKTGKAIELFTAAIAAEDKQLASVSQPAIAVASNTGANHQNTFVPLPAQAGRSTLPRQAMADALGESSPQSAAPLVAEAPRAIPTPVTLAQAPAYESPSVRTVTSAVVNTVPASPQALTPEPLPQDLPPSSAAPYRAAEVLPQSERFSQPPVARQADPTPLAAPADSGTMLGLRTDKASRLREELASLLETRNPEVKLGTFARGNNGEEGLGKLTEVQTPLEVRMPVGDGMLALQATAVQLNAGSIGEDFYSHSRFGGGSVAIYDTIAQTGQWGNPQALNTIAPTGKQRDSGVGLSIAYEMQRLRMDIGSTPLGFRRVNVVGGLKYDGMFDERTRSWYSVELSRRAVTDSLTSFAGAYDSRSGQTWGGVTSTGLQFQAGQDGDRFGFYGYGGAHALRGYNVASNWRANVGGGVYWHLLREEDRIFTAGLNLGGTFYGKNQRFFTYGHGGYFSPQSMYSFSVPFTWAQRSGRFTYKLQGAIGLQYFKEDEADYFPTDAGMQARAITAAQYASAMGFGGATATYAGQSKTGVGYSLQAAAEYRLTDHLVLGSALAFNNAKDYRQWAGGLYLRYTLYPSSGLMALPVTPYRGPYGN
ncbi:BCSC C-terminal domain-containing protein [Pusillimonas sp. CC-YST705]|uniref:BCSC C-terminal domain-containing protein n=1 Tax=Mesopusillimonas faecipullorum TaxID=2755040 RepID=A0ABS8CET0_9BURK|nr:cellulose biosynthesis protein BcsC [Mesopusillimonas faecipullorum]MCB5364541.1 BCSC C-terminal domain-containing protein [Mesopusillimonas faecipullorum]